MMKTLKQKGTISSGVKRKLWENGLLPSKSGSQQRLGTTPSSRPNRHHSRKETELDHRGKQQVRLHSFIHDIDMLRFTSEKYQKEKIFELAKALRTPRAGILR